MRRILIWIICLMPTFSYSHEKVIVHSLEKSVDLSPINDTRVEKREGLVPGQSPQKLLSVSKRDEFFQKAGLAEEVRKMDQMDRDLLYLTVERYELEAVTKKYPHLPVNKISVLKKLLSKK
jgi:hypothetical protein